MKIGIFLCKNRFFTDNPSANIVQAEFVTGTGITAKTKNLWEKRQYCSMNIEDLKEIQKLNINQMARNLLTDERKYINLDCDIE
jgi:hypothetical protein